VPTLVASIRPAPAAGTYVLRGLSARLRVHPHVNCAPGQLLVTVPRLGTILVSELRTLLRVDITVESEDAAARACATLLREIGSADVVIGWARDESLSNA
jgi:hypothetical protein